MLKSTEMGTFLVQILDQQHESWQGTITWLANNEKKSFRSLLELVLMINDKMGGDQKADTPKGSKSDDDAKSDSADLSSEDKRENVSFIESYNQPQASSKRIAQTG